jgi:carbonic anhydrase
MKTLRLITIGFVGCVLALALGLKSAQADDPHAVLVTCVDPRLDLAAHARVIRMLPRGVDPSSDTKLDDTPSAYHFTLAGCSKCIAEKDETQKSLLDQLEDLRSKGAKLEVIDLVDHDTCLAYVPDDSEARHKKYLNDAFEILHAKFPRANVRRWIYKMATGSLWVYDPATETFKEVKSPKDIPVALRPSE